MAQSVVQPLPLPALHASHAGTWLRDGIGVTRGCSKGEAIMAAADTPVLLHNAPLVASRLGYPDLFGLDLLELFEERYQRRSTIITAQLPVSGWHDMIGEPTIADAILDRIVHNAHRIDLKGDSMRRKDQNVNLTARENTETVHTET